MVQRTVWSALLSTVLACMYSTPSGVPRVPSLVVSVTLVYFLYIRTSFYFSVSFICFPTTSPASSLSITNNSDPGSRSGHFSPHPLPVAVCAFMFIAGTGHSAVSPFPRRIASNCAYRTHMHIAVGAFCRSILPRVPGYPLTLLGPQSRFGGKLLGI